MKCTLHVRHLVSIKAAITKKLRVKKLLKIFFISADLIMYPHHFSGKGYSLVISEITVLTLNPAIIVMIMLSALYFYCIYSSVLRLDFILKATTMNPDQTAPLILVHIVCNIG